jgi:hypothetical protein
VLVLDENIRLEQKAILAARGIRSRKIGPDLAAHGAADADLIPLLLTLPKPTFFTGRNLLKPKPHPCFATSGRRIARLTKIQDGERETFRKAMQHARVVSRNSPKRKNPRGRGLRALPNSCRIECAILRFWRVTVRNVVFP